VTVPAATRYPGVGPRAVATIVDGVVGLFVIGIPVALVFGKHTTVRSGHNVSASYSVTSTTGLALWILLVIAYYAIFEWWIGATPGKLLLGLRVRSLDGTRPTLRAATIRNAMRVVDAFPYFIPYLVAAITVWSDETDRQRLGDRAAKTVVTYR